MCKQRGPLAHLKRPSAAERAKKQLSTFTLATFKCFATRLLAQGGTPSLNAWYTLYTTIRAYINATPNRDFKMYSVHKHFKMFGIVKLCERCPFRVIAKKN